MLERERADKQVGCDELRPVARSLLSMGSDDPSARTLRVDTAGLDADAVTLDALARLQLAARRCGFELRLHGSSSELRELIEFAGLEAALPEEPLGVQPGR